MYSDIIVWITRFFSYFGAIFIFYGGIRAIAGIISIEILRKPIAYNTIRIDFTSKIVLSLEFFIAADLIKTILEPTVDQVVVLAVIVAIRTVVGYFLDKEAKELTLKDKSQ
ncbi:MAG: DUF1622 domain-containing protein [Methanobacteriaceae archaeon]|jgi:uncharacterized membrane protein|nr:MAG: hypothetical protein CIT01_04635 [Methanobacterium sp. BRmetb2]MCC7558046.1 DUF1622 domain-containing protein [Methanobacteriaceae archaeon]